MIRRPSDPSRGPNDPSTVRGRPQRGPRDTPPSRRPGLPPRDPNWRLSDLLDRLQREYSNEIAERGRDKSLFPYVLIRGTAGDRGARPLWQPTPFWVSPDIHLFRPGTEGDLSQAVQSPVAGEQYAVGVHVWNLGRGMAAGVVVRAYWVEPGFFEGTDPSYTPHEISKTFVTVGNRDQPTAHRLVILPDPWRVVWNTQAHECLFAVAYHAMDNWDGVLDANGNRHVAQRNLTLVQGAEDAAPVIDELGKRVQVGQRLQLLVAPIKAMSLAGAVERRDATQDDTRVGFGPIALAPPEPMGALTKGRGGFWQRAHPVSARPFRSQSLATLLRRATNADATTARALLESPAIGPSAAAAIHLVARHSGYTIALYR